MKTNLEKYAEEMSKNIQTIGLDCYHWTEVATVIDELLKYADFRNYNKNDGLSFVGYTNGDQISYASKNDDCGEGCFYFDTKNECYIPLYMLKNHLHRIELTSSQNITAEMIGIK